MATFLLLHGKWHDGSCWDGLTPELTGLGHTCLAPDMPFHDPAATHEMRAQPALEALAGTAEPLVVVGHSLGAGIAPLVADRAGAALVVYLCPAATGPFSGVDVGVRPIRPGFPFPPDAEDGTSEWEADAAVAAMYPRLPAKDARELAASLHPGSSPSDAHPLDGHPDLPGLLILALHDEFFVPEWSRGVASQVLGRDAIELDTGHFPMAEAPAELARVLDGLA